MKSRYTILNAVMNYDNIVEVINHQTKNQVVNLGWLIPSSPYKLKNHETVGVWKIKKLKN